MKIENEKSDRIRYIRALEKFTKSCISILKRQDFSFDIFFQKISINEKALRKAKPVFLDQPYTKALEKYVNFVLFSVKNNEKTDDLKALLTKEANNLEKLKHSGTYKKEKHKKNNFEDGY